jgi:Bacterial phospho-glucose isomerase C-terminal SIS domain
MVDVFDETLLDNALALSAFDDELRHLAESGARVRREAAASAGHLDALSAEGMPRAVLAAGSDARLLRAVLEPWCPVPFVAWPGPGLPGWAGPLDLVVVLAPDADPTAIPVVAEANRRGCTLIVGCPASSTLAEASAGRHSTVLPTETADTLAAAVVALQALHGLGIGPEVVADDVARSLDDVAIACSPQQEVGFNPGKDLAIALADDLPVVWGGSVLAARAARRIAEALRRSSGRATLAADAQHLIPVIEAAQPRDVFADPFADPQAIAQRPSLLIVDDGADEPLINQTVQRLESLARDHEVRVHRIGTGVESPVARYAAVLSQGLYTATYLAIGLGREAGVARDIGPRRVPDSHDELRPDHGDRPHGDVE